MDHHNNKLALEYDISKIKIREQFENAIDEKTRCIYGETLPNPKLQVFPIEEVGKIGKKHHVPLILDNTAAPYICKPLNYGANIVVYSTTKYIGGHGLSIGGLLILSQGSVIAPFIYIIF